MDPPLPTAPRDPDEERVIMALRGIGHTFPNPTWLFKSAGNNITQTLN